MLKLTPWTRVLKNMMLPAYQPAASWVYYTTSCIHSLVFLRMGEIIARNMLSWLELLINRYCCI